MAGNEKNKKWFVVMAAVIVCFAFAGAARAGIGWQERQKLLAAGGRRSRWRWQGIANIWCILIIFSCVVS